MALQLWGLIGILLIVGLIVSIILGKIKYFLPLSLFKTAHSSASMGLLVNYNIYNAPEAVKQGPDIPYFPIAIGTIVFCLAMLSLFINKLSNRSINLPVRLRWLWFSCGAVILGIGAFLATAALYSPNLFGYGRTPLPGLACYFWLPFITVASPIFYKVSRMNADTSPNVMRYVVFLVACYSIIITMGLSLIMRQAILVTKISYVYWGAIITLGLLPPSLVILGIAKDYLPLGVVGQSSSAPSISKNIEE
jgi:hypothetical protein